MARRKLTSIYGSFHVRTDELLRDFLIGPPSPPVRLGGLPFHTLLMYSRGYLVNRFFHLWGEFCRHVVTTSALGGCTTMDGMFLNSARGISCVSDILNAINANSISGPSLRWGDPTWTVRRASRIQPANIQQISLGVGAVPYDEVRRVRNFIMHSNPHTRAEFDRVAIRYSLPGISADALLLHRLPGGFTLMESMGKGFPDCRSRDCSLTCTLPSAKNLAALLTHHN